MKLLLLQTASEGDLLISSEDGAIWYIYEVTEPGGKKVSILVGDNGYIVTAIPKSKEEKL